LLALDDSGGLLWSFPRVSDEALGSVLYGAPAADGERVYLGTYTGELYALDADTGEMATEWSTNPIVIEDAHIIGGPTLVEREQCVAADRRVVEGGVLLFGTTDNALYAVCAGNGSLVWRVETQGEVWGAPTVSEDTVDATVYAGSQDGHLYAISLERGTPVWARAFKAGGAIMAQPLVVDGKVFIGALDGKMYALDAASGTPVWPKPFDGGSWFWAGAISDGESLYAVTVKGRVAALNLDTGVKQWETDLNTMVISTPVMAQSQGRTRLVVGTKVGQIALLYADSGQEDGGRIPIEDGRNGSVKLKASLGVFESIVYVNTLDSWTTQAMDLDAGGEVFWICPPSCVGVNQ